MYRNETLQSLIEQNAAYRFFKEKYEIPHVLLTKSVSELCEEQQLNAEIIQVLLQTYDENLAFPYAALKRFSMEDIVAYLQLTHRFYLNKKLPEIEQTIQNLYKDYAQSDELLVMLCAFFVHYKAKLEQHILLEETVLFPYVKSLLELEHGKVDLANLQETHQGFSAHYFVQAHTDIEEDLQHVRQHIEQAMQHRKTPLPFRVFLLQLQHFEVDLCKHAMIEDEVLIPQVLQLEKDWNLDVAFNWS